MTKPTSISLILLSLALLLVFETLWLNRVWKEQFEHLEQETNYLFQQTVMALQDSLVSRSFKSEQPPHDSLAVPQHVLNLDKRNTEHLADAPAGAFRFQTRSKVTVQIRSDSTMPLLSDTTGLGEYQVYIMRSAPGDTGSIHGLNRVLHNLPKKNWSPSQGQQFFKLGKNLIPTDQLEQQYKSVLEGAGIGLEFKLMLSDSMPFQDIQRPELSTKPAWAGFMSEAVYTAVFPHYKAYLVREIIPALLFALLLFGITATAFILIYRSMRQQQRLSQLKNDFISNITHELKTPITTVGVALEALSTFDSGGKPEKMREYLAHSRLELDRLSLLVDKVLRLSMFEEQEPRLQFETVDLAAVVRQVLAAMTLQAERTGANLRVAIPAGESFAVLGDKLHLSSVVFNLLDNALKYTDENPQIEVSLEKSSGFVRIAVRDNGAGISEALQEKIFDKFFRIQDGDRHNVKGHGLGLSYALKVIQQHGGRIWVESTPGEGSVFIVELKDHTSS